MRKLIEQALATARREEIARERDHEAFMAQMEATDRMKQRDVMPNLRPTTVAEYAAFAKGYIESGGQIGHVYDYPLTRYYTALRDFTLPPLFGAQSVNVLVPVGVRVDRGGWGHSDILYMDGFRLDGHGLALYSDVADYLRRS